MNPEKNIATIRVKLPAHLRKLAQVDGEVELHVDGQVTQGSILDALEARYPMLRGTIRDHTTSKRRAFLRFFACQHDLSHDPQTPPTQPGHHRHRTIPGHWSTLLAGTGKVLVVGIRREPG